MLSKERGKKVLVPENFLRRCHNNGANLMEQREFFCSAGQSTRLPLRRSPRRHTEKCSSGRLQTGQRVPPKSLLSCSCGSHLCLIRDDSGGHRHLGSDASAPLLPHLEMRSGMALVSSQPAWSPSSPPLSPEACLFRPISLSQEARKGRTEEKCTFCKFQWKAFGEGG